MPDSAPRDATPADLPALLALEAQFPGDRMSARQYRRHLASPRARIRVAERDGTLAGASVLLFRAGSATARLYSIVVDPARRGQGLGRRLLDDAENLARARGCTRLRLEVRADNPAALALYEGAGYRRLAALPGYYEDGGDGLRLEKALPTPP
ncbi:GNAT family N-acetyltransferase [Rehaibacterium terrae]|jgi:ribosomal-protein-alanine N-acetyltransferase|uniref:Ribosomal protein S18 acetylase RimI-like enzyme n=1 Tax=Rehaibacterium terrae TaxID=1341696 RepID=A0A7W7XYI9_9GAMM|nr:GNAT family N-acetyltransferase [Rehaibacterium terrae]MBB5014782.1 ribosomal protein S18 acetylase RimI-like enzyme [Rehaibacterium terrae]